MELDLPWEVSSSSESNHEVLSQQSNHDSATVKEEGQDESSASQSERIENANANVTSGRKRKRETKGKRYKKKRRALEYSKEVTEYQKLYHAEVHEFEHRFECPEHCTEKSVPRRQRMKQYGMSKWMGKEQDQLFRGLSRYGSGNLDQLSAVVPSKSEFEILQYLQLLKLSLNNHVMRRASNQRLAEYDVIPASLEVSEQCCNMLDEIAHEYSCVDSERLEAVARYDYGPLGVLDRTKAAQLAQVADGEVSPGTELQHAIAQLPPLAHPALNLFKVSNWLELSETLYMNSATQDNWHAIAKEEQSPSILLTPVLELYTIIVTLTKRLVSASNFQALSRLRANDYKKHERGEMPEVTVDDVRTALDIFNVEHDSSKYWLRVAERCKLTIYAENKSRLSYDEVARCLAFGYSIRESRSLGVASQKFVQEETNLSDSEVPLLPLDGEEENDVTIKIHDQANAVDQRNSLEHENQLWATFNRSPSSPNQTEPKQDAYLKLKKSATGHQPEDFNDWRDKIDYRAEWQRYGYTVPQHEFEGSSTARTQRAVEGWPQNRPPAESPPLLSFEDETMDDADVASSSHGISEAISDEERGRGRTPRSVEGDSHAAGFSLLPRRSARSASLRRPDYTIQPMDTDGAVTAPRFDLSSDEDEYEPDENVQA